MWSWQAAGAGRRAKANLSEQQLGLSLSLLSSLCCSNHPGYPHSYTNPSPALTQPTALASLSQLALLRSSSLPLSCSAPRPTPPAPSTRTPKCHRLPPRTASLLRTWDQRPRLDPRRDTQRLSSSVQAPQVSSQLRRYRRSPDELTNDQISPGHTAAIYLARANLQPVMFEVSTRVSQRREVVGDGEVGRGGCSRQHLPHPAVVDAPP